MSEHDHDMTRLHNQRVRRQMLAALYDQRHNTLGLSGTMLHDLFGPSAFAVHHTASEDETQALLSDLVNAGLIRMIDRRRYQSDPQDLAHSSYAITGDGTALIEEAIPPHDLVYDPRIRPRIRKDHA